MTRIQTSLVVLTAALLTACGTAMTTHSNSGFLSSYADLSTSEDKPSASIRSIAKIDPQKITVTEVVWRAADSAQLSEAEQAKLLTQLRSDLTQQSSTLPSAPDGRPVRLRAAITRVETVSPALNTLGTVLLVGPLDRGGVAVEIEALDAETGRQLAGLRMGYYAPLSELSARFSKLAPAEFALQRAARTFVDLLQPEQAALASAR